MPVVVQCSNCGKKLKMKEPSPGKKLRCPGCKEPFIPQSGRKAGPGDGPRKRKRPAPVDDFSDDFAEEDFGGEANFGQPSRPSRGKSAVGKKTSAKGAAGKKTAAKKVAGKKSVTKKAAQGKKAGASKKSRAPLFIGVGALGLALAAGVTVMLMSSNDEGDSSAGDGTAVVDDAVEDQAQGDAAAQGMDVNGIAGTDAEPSTDPVADAGADTDTPELQWLPEDSEVFVKLDVQKLLAGPIGGLLKNPMLAQQLDGIQQQAGLRVEDIESVVFGMAGVSESVGSSQPPDPGSLPMAAVIRTTVPVDISRLQSAIPKSMAVNDGRVAFVRLPESAPQAPPLALWAADSTTIVVTAESLLPTVAAMTSIPKSPIDRTLLASSSALHIVFVPSDPDKVFRSEPAPTSTSDPAKQPMIDFGQVVQPVMSGLRFDLDITNDMQMDGAILTTTANAAGDVTAALQKLIADTKKLQQDDTAGEVPAMMQMAMAQGAQALDAVIVNANGTAAEFSYTAAGAGQQIAMMGPMLPMMIGGAMSQAQQAIKAAQPADSLKNIAQAMQNFSSLYGRFPNASSTDGSGRKLLSWRVHLLPFLGHEDLYDQFALDEAWNSETNRPLVDQMPEIYSTQDTAVEPGKTLYQVVVGPGTAFEDSKGHAIRDFTDGTSGTVLLLEVAPDRSVFWTEPADHTFEPSQPMQGLGGVAADGFRVALADGAVKTIASTTPVDVVRGIMTRNGGEPVRP